MNKGIQAAALEIHQKYAIDSGATQEIIRRHLSSLNEASAVRDDSGDIKFQDNTQFDCCDEPVLFQMQDNYHEFFVGLHIILNCLKLAEEKGYIPNLPSEWWLNVQLRCY